ncbi:MAG: hypothetical protein KJO07_18205, partial [Deltaproteobacteria bacterium]|nr:hypothetical protein [Deltaproteobacteria bacterium]
MIAACSIGCTQHIYRAPRPSEVGGPVVVTTREGQVIRASRASVSEGKIEVPYARQRRRLDLTSVERVETRARTRGLIFGALGGAAVGF